MLKKHLLTIAFALTSFTMICTANTPELLRDRADIVREEGKTLEALDLYNQALVGFQQKHDYCGVLDALIGRLISWQHLYNHENDPLFAVLARKEAEAMLAIAQEYSIHDRDRLIHFFLGKSSVFLHDYPAAESEFALAVALYPQENAEKGDWLAHLGEAIYQNGRKEEGEKIMPEGIQQIQAHQEGVDSFRINVWTSGAYLRLAKLFIDDGKPEQAELYLFRGEEIILKDPRLIIRKQQLDILKKKVSRYKFNCSAK